MSNNSEYNGIDLDNKSQFYQFYEIASHPFSKFFDASIIINNVEYKTVEHWYQCSKYITTNAKIYQLILNADSVEAAHLLGYNNKKDIRDDWFNVNKDIYYQGQKAKFDQYPELKKKLMDTNDKDIICIDSVEFWGLTVVQDVDNKQVFKGKNNAGKLLQKLRNEYLQNENEETKNNDNHHEEIYEFYEVYTHPFSKFYSAEINIDGIKYLTVEHYYQSQKFVNSDPGLYQMILQTKSIEEAHLLGQITGNVRSDWFSVNRDIYVKAQKIKFEQHEDLKNILLETKEKYIRCIDTDTFWGMSVNHNNNNQKLNGQNNSGVLLMRIRDEFLAENQQNETKQDGLINKIDQTIKFVEQSI